MQLLPSVSQTRAEGPKEKHQTEGFVETWILGTVFIAFDGKLDLFA